MKHLTLIFLLILFSPVSTTLAQQTSQSVLVDQFHSVTCEELWARLDGFLSQINGAPETTATIAMAGKIGELRDDLWIEDMIRIYFMQRKLSQNRWRIVRTRPEKERNLEFWITPAGAEPPKIETAEWSLKYPPGTKPFLFAYDPDYMEEVSVCLLSNRLRLLAQVLKANPDAHTNVVLIVRSQKAFLRKKRRTISELNDYGIRMRQIRIFRKISRKPNPYNIDPDAKYWFVPAKSAGTTK